MQCFLICPLKLISVLKNKFFEKIVSFLFCLFHIHLIALLLLMIYIESMKRSLSTQLFIATLITITTEFISEIII